MSWLKKFVRLRTLVVLLLGLVLYFLIFTTWGAHKIIDSLHWFLPGHVQVSGLSGTVYNGVTVKRVQYDDPDLAITAANVQLKLALAPLLHWEIEITRLASETLDIRQKINANTTNHFTLPKHLRIDATALPKITYTSSDGKTIIKGELSVTGNNDLLTLNFVSRLPVQMTVSGSYRSADRIAPLHLIANWSELPKFNVQQTYQMKQGTLKLDGTFAKLQMQLKTQIKSTLIPQSELRIYAHSQDRQLTIDQGTWQLPQGRLELAGRFNYFSEWKAHVTGIDVDPGLFHPSVSGKIRFAINANGKDFTLLGIQAVELSNLAGLWRGLPITGHGQFTHPSPHRWQIDGAQFVLADNQCHIQGGYNDNWDLNWQCQLNHLDALSSDLQGDLVSSGSFTGKGDKAHANAVLASKLFRFHQIAFKQLQAKVSGQLSQHQVQASWQSFEKNNSLSLNGAFNNGLWRGDLDALALAFTDHFWTLQKKAHIELGRNAAKSDPVCVQSNNQQACLRLRGDPKQWSTDLVLHQVQLAPVLTLFALPVDSSSTCDLHLQLQGQDYHATGSLDATLSSSSLTVHENQKEYPLVLNSAAIKATLTSNGLQSQIHAVLNKVDTIDAKIAMPDFRLPLRTNLIDQAMQGEAHVTLSDITWISAFLKQLNGIQGRIIGNLELAGTLAKPKIRGSASLQHFNADLKDLGLHLIEGTLTATPADQGIAITGSVKSGDGTLQIRGTVPVLFGNTAYMLDLTGDNIMIANTKNYKVWANSNLHFKLDQNGYTLIGLLTIPKATATPDDFSNTVEMPQEVKFVDEKEPVEANLPFSTDLQLQLGDAVNINTHGLTGMLKGKLHIVSPANQPTTLATGILTVDKGFYNTNGQQLTLEKGELLYTGGDILNPGMSITAYRTVQTTGTTPVDKPFANLLSGADVLGFNQQNIRVGVKVTGTADHPKVDLYSQPAGLSNSDILSYLILNRPLSQVSRENASSLLGAVGAMALSGHHTSGVYRDIQKNLGLDDLSLTTLPNNLQNNQDGLAPSNAAISIGKALSPRLHVQYTQGLSSPVGFGQIRYVLTKQWTIQAEASQISQAFDILFTKER